tara:strand:+ start:305 stop:1132 length:828 start_codon:yes stop_codon:yes gene_type:complete
MNISAKEVQELRKISGAGMMECKSALSEANGDVDVAFKLLREKGIAKAEKKSAREANEGLIGIMVKNQLATMVEINSETDFVSRNAEFHKLVYEILEISLENNEDYEKTRSLASEIISQGVGKIGENIVLRRIDIMRGKVFSYIHNNVADNLGKIGVLLTLECENDDLNDIGKKLSMHIAASSPKSISVDDLDEDIIESEKNIITEQLKGSGKSEEIVKKMLTGKMKKFFDEVTLMGQKFVMDPSISITEYLEQSSHSLGSKVKVKKFLRYEIGN